MSISCMTRVGYPTLVEYSSGRRVKTLRLGRCRLELVEWHDEPLARFEIDDLGAPVGHAHGVMSKQDKDTSVMEDLVANSHESRSQLRTTPYPVSIGSERRRRHPLICVTRLRNRFRVSGGCSDPLHRRCSNSGSRTSNRSRRSPRTT